MQSPIVRGFVQFRATFHPNPRLWQSTEIRHPFAFSANPPLYFLTFALKFFIFTKLLFKNISRKVIFSPKRLLTKQKIVVNLKRAFNPPLYTPVWPLHGSEYRTNKCPVFTHWNTIQICPIFKQWFENRTGYSNTILIKV